VGLIGASRAIGALAWLESTETVGTSRYFRGCLRIETPSAALVLLTPLFTPVPSRKRQGGPLNQEYFHPD
jgi:hypothetical protein